MIKRKSEFKKSNLISLVWSELGYHSSLESGVPKKVTLDLVAGKWIFGGLSYSIGDSCLSFREVAGNPIGVYDRTKIKHLRKMKVAIESIRIKGNWMAG